MVENEKKYADWQIEEIIAYCQEHNEVEWLKATASKQIERPIYPKVESVSKTGKKTMRMDKTAKPIGTKMDKISFVELKSEFIEHFKLGEEKEPAKPSFYEIIANL